ncbi:MAG: S-layer protein, partial [Methanomicrobia archaeon]|nr:S-layer protein [Methanomicrobia archaeon]
MKIKKIGAILAGAVMIGSAVAAAWDPSDHTDFFVDPDTGDPNSIIVVGANAAASDVTAAGWIAAQIGSMAHYEEIIPQYDEATWFSGNNHVDDNNGSDPGNLGTNNATYNCDALAVGDVFGTFNLLPYVELESLWWDDKNANDMLENDESREEVFVNFTQDPMTGIYPIIDLYDFQYRTVIEDDPEFLIWFGGQYNITPYALVDEPVGVKWLCDFYDIIGWGYDSVSGDDYVVYGTPHFSEDECRGDDEMVFDVGETKLFYGWEITLDDINIYENKVQWLIKGPTDETPCEYIVAISGYEPDIPPSEWNEYNRHCLASVQLKACEYDVIGI